MTAPAVARRWRQSTRVPLAALLATCLVVHAAVAPHLAVRGMPPDVLLVAVVAVAAVRGERIGAAFGFAAGLGADVFLATPLGTSALAYTLLGHILGGRHEPRRSMLLAFAGVIAGRLMTAATATALGGVPFPEPAGLLRILGVAALSAPLGPPTVALVRRISSAGATRR